MNQLISVIIWTSLCFTSLYSHTVTNEWTVPIADLEDKGLKVSRLQDKVLVTTIHEAKENRASSYMHFQTFNLSGVLQEDCPLSMTSQATLPHADKLKVTSFREDYFTVSWLQVRTYNSTSGSPVYQCDLVVYVMSIAGCASFKREITLIESSELEDVENLTYDVIADFASETVYMFVPSPLLCDAGICKMKISVSHGNPEEPIEATTFVEDVPDIWMLIPIDTNDLSQGYYFITKNSTYREISKLDPEGTILESTDLLETPISVNTTYSNAFGNLSLCHTNLTSYRADCRRIDTSINKLFLIGVRFENTISRTIEVMNMKNGSFFVWTQLTREVATAGNTTLVHDVVPAKKVETNGTASENFDFLAAEEGEVAAFVQQGFLDEQNELYCDALPLYVDVEGVRTTKLRVKCITFT